MTPLDFKFNFDDLQKQIKKSVDEIQKQANFSPNFTLPNFNLKNLTSLNLEDAPKVLANNLEDTTKVVIQSLERVEKAFDGIVGGIVGVINTVNGTQVGLPQIDAGKVAAINEIKTFSDAVVEGISGLRDLLSTFKLNFD